MDDKRVSRKSTDKYVAEIAVCPIDGGAMTEPVVMSCGHSFCKACISMWAMRNNTCPVCRAPIYGSTGRVSFIRVPVLCDALERISVLECAAQTRDAAQKALTERIAELEQMAAAVHKKSTKRITELERMILELSKEKLDLNLDIATHCYKLGELFKAMLRKRDKNAVRSIVLWFNNVSGARYILVDALQETVTCVCREEVIAAETAIQTLVTVRERFDTMIRKVHIVGDMYAEAVHQGFVVAMHGNEIIETDKNLSIPGIETGLPKAPQFLAMFCDTVLRRKCAAFDKTLSDSVEAILERSHETDIFDAEIDRTLNTIVALAKCVHDKDVFVLKYRNYLAKRMVLGAGGSNMRAEVAMLDKLKTSFGYEMVALPLRILDDARKSVGINADFQIYCAAENLEIKFPFSVSVGTTCAWPFTIPSTPSRFAPPPEVVSASAWFGTFYKKRFETRKLTFLHHIGSVDMAMRLNGSCDNKNLLNVSPFNASVLLLFASAETGGIKMSDIFAGTKLHDSRRGWAMQQLEQLVDKRILLVTSAPGAEWLGPKDDGTTFAVNDKFESGDLDIVCGYQLGDNIPSCLAGCEKEMSMDRVARTQAAVFKVIKASRVMTHTELCNGATERLSRWFVPSVLELKRAIEWLIDKEYMIRSRTSASTYEHVA